MNEQPTNFNYAPFWKRVIAFVMDLLIVVALYSLLIYILNLILKLPVEYSPIVERGLSLKISPYVEDTFLVIALLYSLSKLLVLYPYFVLMESSRLQGTIGKLILGLKVTDTFGRRISFGRASGRFFGKLLSGQILLIGYLMAALTAKKQALHDVLARTLVIYKGSVLLAAAKPNKSFERTAS